MSVGPERDNVTYLYKRGCTISGGKKDFCDEEYQLDPENKCFLCHNDFCNDGFVLNAMKILIIVTVMLNILCLKNLFLFFSQNH